MEEDEHVVHESAISPRSGHPFRRPAGWRVGVCGTARRWPGFAYFQRPAGWKRSRRPLDGGRGKKFIIRIGLGFVEHRADRRGWRMRHARQVDGTGRGERREADRPGREDRAGQRKGLQRQSFRESDGDHEHRRDGRKLSRIRKDSREMARSKHPLADDILTECGVMGVYDTSLSLADAEILGRAFATFLIRRGGGCVAVCFDSRPSSPDLATALMSGLTRAGAEALRLGSGPLPMLHFGADRLGADAAVMVTGADAPMEYNGVRLFRKGRRICAQEMLAVADYAALGDFESGGGVQRDTPIASSYVEDLARLSTDRMSLLTVLWDAGFG
ncbi:MAG TPA: hypothetical protein ENO14_00915, partial [Chromatiales bacterium]|nr:hypothetical protein [Chromatiales bacterium]